MHDYNTIVGVISLRNDKVSYPVIRQRYGIGNSGIDLIMNRYKESGLPWKDFLKLEPSQIEELIYSPKNIRKNDIPKVEGREDDPYLIDKLRKERDGIFLWALEGLQRLISNNYVFTESVDAKQNLVDAQEEGNNILAFMKSEGYLQFEIGKKISSTDFYNIYVSWCEDNLEKPRASAGFLHYIKENQKRYGLIYDAKCIGNRRGFHNVCKAEFTPVAGKTPFD